MSSTSQEKDGVRRSVLLRANVMPLRRPAQRVSRQGRCEGGGGVHTSGPRTGIMGLIELFVAGWWHDVRARSVFPAPRER